MEEALEFMLRFILLEMKELESKKAESPLLDPMFCHKEFDEVPPSLYRMGLLHGNFWRNT